MSRIAYVNGRYVAHYEAAVHIEDRGYQFADGVYEVIAVAKTCLVDTKLHYDRLERSLSQIKIDQPITRAALDVVMREVVRRNRIQNGMVYLQVTRGVAKRDHQFPEFAQPSIVVTARRGGRPSAENREDGVSVVTVPDIRWARCDIKSISLLPNVLAKQAAREAGGFEAWLVDEDGMVTEGSSTNAWIVNIDDNLVTRPLANSILSGITRLVLKQVAEESGVRVIERAFSVEEAKSAREAFITSTTNFVTPVVRIDDRVIASGRPGSITKQLIKFYDRHLPTSF